MKLSFGFACLMGGMLNAQINSYPATGNIPFNMPASTPANFNLQLHGTTDYSVNTRESGTVLYGKTARFGMTNTTTGLTSTDGFLFRMSGINFAMENLESGEIRLATNGLSLNLSGSAQRVFLGGSVSTATENAVFNINTNDNGLYIRTTAASKYGVSIRSHSLTDDAIIVNTVATATNNFNVKASGQTSIYYPLTSNTDKVLLIRNASQKLLQLTNDGILKTREVNVDLVAWADYVFTPSYRLMPLKEVSNFIKVNGHLPNVPKAAIIESGGLNVGDMTKTLMEKVEELTLYLIEQQKLLEQQQAEINALKTAK